MCAGTGCTRGREARAVAHEVLDAQRLQRERHVHHRGGMALRRGEVDDAAAGEEVQPAVAEVVLLDERADLAHAAGRQVAQVARR